MAVMACIAHRSQTIALGAFIAFIAFMAFVPFIAFMAFIMFSQAAVSFDGLLKKPYLYS